MEFADISDYTIDVEDWSVEASEGYADLTNFEATLSTYEIGDILDESEFLDWCKRQGMTISKKPDGEVIIETNWDMNDEGGISPR